MMPLSTGAFPVDLQQEFNKRMLEPPPKLEDEECITAISPEIQQHFDQKLLQRESRTIHSNMYNPSRLLPDNPSTSDFFDEYSRNQAKPKYKVRSKVVMKNDGFVDSIWRCGYQPVGDGTIWINNKTGEVWNVNDT